MDNIFEVDTKLNLVNYILVVDSIANGYFNEQGEYKPHYGILNVMRIFYNICVKKCKFDDEHPHDITDVLDLSDIVSDEVFLTVFNDALVLDRREINFANAYSDAMDIVNMKNKSISRAVDFIKNAISDLLGNINSLMTEENLDYITSIAKDLSNGETITADKIVEAYGKYQGFNKMVETVNVNDSNLEETK